MRGFTVSTRSYNGSAFCGCPNCIEYVAEREYEDEV